MAQTRDPMVDTTQHLFPMPGPSAHDAVLSTCGRYRYRLTRTWSQNRPPATFIMLNPSTADAHEDDKTIRRCIGYARRWGLGGLVVVNLYGYRSTNPDELWKVEDPVGPDNDHHLRAVLADAAKEGYLWWRPGARRPNSRG